MYQVSTSLRARFGSSPRQSCYHFPPLSQRWFQLWNIGHTRIFKLEIWRLIRLWWLVLTRACRVADNSYSGLQAAALWAPSEILSFEICSVRPYSLAVRVLRILSFKNAGKLTVKTGHVQWSGVNQSVALAQFSGQKLWAAEEVDQVILVHRDPISDIPAL